MSNPAALEGVVTFNVSNRDVVHHEKMAMHYERMASFRKRRSDEGNANSSNQRGEDR